MGVMDWLGLGKTAGQAIAEPVSAVGNVLDKLFTSDEERLDRQTALQRLFMKPALAQTEINKIEAQHRSRFVAGWRPSIGWVCGIALFFYFVPQYVVGAWAWSKACYVALDAQGAAELIKAGLPKYPVSADGLFELVMALLGMGGIRMVEKLNGKAK